MIPSAASYARAMAKFSSRSPSWALKCILALNFFVVNLPQTLPNRQATGLKTPRQLTFQCIPCGGAGWTVRCSHCGSAQLVRKGFGR